MYRLVCVPFTIFAVLRAVVSMVRLLYIQWVFYDVLSPTILVFLEGTSIQRLKWKHTVMRITTKNCGEGDSTRV